MENSNLSVVRRFYDAFNQKDQAILDQVIAGDYVDYGHQPPGQGIQGAKDDFQGFTTAFPDGRFEIDELIDAGDRVVARWTARGTHGGPFIGIAPTQKKIEMRGMSLYRLRDGKIVETRNQPDLLSLFTQIGVVEMKGKKAA